MFNVSRRKVARVLVRREVEIKKSNFIVSKKLELCDFISMYSHYIYNSRKYAFYNKIKLF